MEDAMLNDNDIMDDFDRWAIWVIEFVFAILLLFAFLLVLAWLVSQPPKPRVAPQFTAAERRYVAERHSFHGITISILDEKTRERYFIRDGEKCRL